MDPLTNQLIRQEGLRLRPYKDTTGKCTIGYGRNCQDNGINKSEAMLMLQNDIHSARADVEKLCEYYGVERWRLGYARLEALVNMAFNIGIGRLGGFKRMWAALAKYDYDEAANEMLDSKWAKQVKGRADELAEQMRTGFYKDIHR